MLLVFGFGGGAIYWGDPNYPHYGYGGVSVGFIVLIILLFLLLGGRL